MIFDEYRAIDYFHGNPQHAISLVAVHPRDSERLYWNGGQAYTIGMEGKHYKTLKVYRVTDFMQAPGEHEDILDMRVQAEDTIEKLFLKEFHQPQAEVAKQSAAWIAPDGMFYPCRYNEHDSLATRLSVWFYDVLSGTALLEEKRWIRLETSGAINYLGKYKNRLTQAQMNTLSDLLLVSSAAFAHSINDELELAEVE